MNKTTSKHPLAKALKCHQKGDLSAAETLYTRALEQNPSDVDALHLMGVLLHQTGRLEHAAAHIRRAIEINPLVPDFFSNLGNIFQDSGEIERAATCYRKALVLDPDHRNATNNLANTLLAAGQNGEALALLENATRRFPNQAIFRHTMGNVYRDSGKYREAIIQFLAALRLDPNMVESWINLGSEWHRSGHTGRAIQCYRRARALAPNRFEIYFNLGNVLNECGEFDAAISSFEKALQIRPDHAGSLYNIVHSRKYATVEKNDCDRIENLLEKPGISATDRIRLEFARAKIFDDAGDYERAFASYRRANQLTRIRSDRRAQECFFDDLVAVCTRQLFDSFKDSGSRSVRPIFIVGMPRSGTSLVEQILTSHPGITGAGELPDAARIAQGLDELTGTDEPYPQNIRRLDRNSIDRAARRYLARLNRVSRDSDRVTDKMPLNFLHLGLLSILFPRATFIHCKRDAADVCLSCYFQNFSREHTFSFDLGDTAHYYRCYGRLMEHWRSTLPVTLHEVSYRDLIENTESVTRNLLAACGMEWDENCLAPHKNVRAVKTASSWQVRQPVYRTSLARWKRYRKFIPELLDELGYSPEQGTR